MVSNSFIAELRLVVGTVSLQSNAPVPFAVCQTLVPVVKKHQTFVQFSSNLFAKIGVYMLQSYENPVP